MKLERIETYLTGKYPSISPREVLLSVRGDRESLLATDIDSVDQEVFLVTRMFVTNPLGYITIERESFDSKKPTMLKIFSFTRGLDFARGLVPPMMIASLVKAKFGFDPLVASRHDGIQTTLSWEGPGLWRAGIQLFFVDEPTEFEIEHAIQFADQFAKYISRIGIEDLWRLRSELGQISDQALDSILTNVQARMFEDRVADYVRRKHGYSDVEVRYRHPTTESPIDVYALKSKLRGTRSVTICECKLRVKDNPIKVDELEKFRDRATRIRDAEAVEAVKTSAKLVFEAWFVTNSRKFPPEALQYVRDVKLRVARLPTNWMRSDNWEILEMEQFANA